MVIFSNSGQTSILGKVLQVTFQRLGVKYLKLERPKGTTCFGKSIALPGNNFDSLTEGANVKLFGQWGSVEYEPRPQLPRPLGKR